MRCVHEAQLHTQNSFLTLTYDDNNLPEWGSLHKPDLQKFFKRLRKSLGTKPIRYYACGEYGENTNRAHYHVCLFGHDFNDKTVLKRTGKHNLYISKTLNELWGHGHTSIGDLNFETAAYTARYVTKKFGEMGGRYARLDEETGEIRTVVQPFAVMSLRPAIGLTWLHKFHNDIYGHDKDYLYMRGRKMRPTKYYDRVYDTINPDRMEFLKYERGRKAEGSTSEQLHARALIARARIIKKTSI